MKRQLVGQTKAAATDNRQPTTNNSTLKLVRFTFQPFVHPTTNVIKKFHSIVGKMQRQRESRIILSYVKEEAGQKNMNHRKNVECRPEIPQSSIIAINQQQLRILSVLN
ncbi:hypothetical protein ACLKA6_012683 [Drosophila palustris]